MVEHMDESASVIRVYDAENEKNVPLSSMSPRRPYLASLWVAGELTYQNLLLLFSSTPGQRPGLQPDSAQLYQFLWRRGPTSYSAFKQSLPLPNQAPWFVLCWLALYWEIIVHPFPTPPF